MRYVSGGNQSRCIFAMTTLVVEKNVGAKCFQKWCLVQSTKEQGFVDAVYFSDADLKANRVKNQRQPISKDRAIALCEAAIKSQLRYPSSFDLKLFDGGGVSDNGTTNREIDLPFTALNGLGNRIPQLGKCIVGPDGHTDVTILNR